MRSAQDRKFQQVMATACLARTDVPTMHPKDKSLKQLLASLEEEDTFAQAPGFAKARQSIRQHNRLACTGA